MASDEEVQASLRHLRGLTSVTGDAAYDTIAFYDARWSFFQPRVPRTPCFTLAHSAFAHDRQSRAIDDQMEASARRDSSMREVEALATP
jgi:hypothetical protein